MAKSKTKITKRDVRKDFDSASRLIVEALARSTEADTKRNIIRGSKTGEKYRVPNTSKIYQASAPGEAPANRTGSLANSYATKVVSDNEAVVFSNLKYAIIEFGTGDIRPRPALRPAMDKTMNDKNKIISSITNRVLK